MNVTIVLGTARKNRNSERVFIALKNAFGDRDDAAVTAVDVREHVTFPETVPPWGEGGVDEAATEWKEIVERTDAFVFIIPEYNHGYPGELKLLLDSLFTEYTGRKAYLVGVSKGTFAGVRAADHIKPVLVELNFVLTKGGLFVGKVAEVLDEDGNVLDEALSGRIEKFVDRVIQKT